MELVIIPVANSEKQSGSNNQPESMRVLTTDVLRGRKAAFALEKEYIRAFESLPNPNVFFSPEWVYSWLLSLGRKYEVCFITCREEGRLVGVWPFFEHRIPVIGTSLLPVGAQAADLFDPVAQEDAMPPMVEALCELCDEYAFAWLPLLSLNFADQVLQPVKKSGLARHFYASARSVFSSSWSASRASRISCKWSSDPRPARASGERPDDWLKKAR
jgi:hypothetical protein